MPATKQRCKRRKKRQFHGNRFSERKEHVTETVYGVVETDADSDTDSDRTTARSSSRRKLDNTDWSFFNEKAESAGLGIFDIDILSDMLKRYALCSMCKNGHLILKETFSGRMGLARQLLLVCDDESCDFKEYFYTSNRCENARAFEVNRRFVVGMRTIGAGLSDMQTLCGIMNMPHPMSKMPTKTY